MHMIRDPKSVENLIITFRINLSSQNLHFIRRKLTQQNIHTFGPPMMFALGFQCTLSASTLECII